MDKQTAQDSFNENYFKTGIIKPKPMVDQVLENKHGIDNPVSDLNTSTNFTANNIIAGNVTIDGSTLTSPRTYTLQDQNGYMTLQVTETLPSARVPFLSGTGLLTTASGFSFSSGTLTVSNLGTSTTVGSAYIYRAGGTDIALADGGTGASLSDPNVDAILFWDDSASQVTFLTVGTGLSITGTVLASSITQYTDEQAQDAIGAMVDDSITYVDATPSLGVTAAYRRKSLFDHFADAGNVSTGEDTLYTDTIAAAQLSNNGEKIEAEYGGVFVSSVTATREIKIYFGGTMIFDTGALTLSLSSSWVVYATIIRVSSSVVRCMVSFTTKGATLAAYTSYTEVTGLTLANTQILKITGEAAGTGAATNDIVAKIGVVEWKAAA